MELCTRANPRAKRQFSSQITLWVSGSNRYCIGESTNLQAPLSHQKARVQLKIAWRAVGVWLRHPIPAVRHEPTSKKDISPIVSLHPPLNNRTKCYVPVVENYLLQKRGENHCRKRVALAPRETEKKTKKTQGLTRGGNSNDMTHGSIT